MLHSELFQAPEPAMPHGDAAHGGLRCVLNQNFSTHHKLNPGCSANVTLEPGSSHCVLLTAVSAA